MPTRLPERRDAKRERLIDHLVVLGFATIFILCTVLWIIVGFALVYIWSWN
jgi:hypothetical protein